MRQDDIHICRSTSLKMSLPPSTSSSFWLLRLRLFTSGAIRAIEPSSWRSNRTTPKACQSCVFRVAHPLVVFAHFIILIVLATWPGPALPNRKKRGKYVARFYRMLSLLRTNGATNEPNGENQRAVFTENDPKLEWQQL